MDKKQKGKCPFCEKQVEAVVAEENTVRRDKCKCPECGEAIYLCRVPGCHDYAKGTSVYDHELCPECTEILSGLAATVGKAGLTILTAFASTVIAGKGKR